MKPKPLNLEFERLYDFFPYEEVEKLMLKIDKEGHNFPHYTTCKTCEADFEEVVRFTIKYVKQRIKSACEFYLQFQSKPFILFYYQNYLTKKQISELMKIIEEIENSPPDIAFEQLYPKYNEWLFKLAFNFKEGENEKI